MSPERSCGSPRSTGSSPHPPCTSLYLFLLPWAVNSHVLSFVFCDRAGVCTPRSHPHCSGKQQEKRQEESAPRVAAGPSGMTCSMSFPYEEEGPRRDTVHHGKVDAVD